MAMMQNWAHNFDYSAARVHRPDTIEQIQEIVAQSSKVKALGTRHSFSNIADTTGDLILMDGFSGIVSTDPRASSVTVQAGIRYGELAQYLNAEGLALHNLASLPHISVAGACATATHGSGVNNRSLASAVVGIKFISGSGEIVSLTMDSRDFEGAVVALGALGIATELTLRVEPAFEIAQTVYNDLPLETLEDNFDEIISCAYSVSLFTQWRRPVIDQVWAKRRMDGPAVPVDLFGASRATANQHPLPDGDVQNCTEQMGVPGPWFDRLPHFRFGFTPSSGEELQTEYFVPREKAVEAILRISHMGEDISPLLQTTEIRSIAADTYWLSPCYQRDSIGIHFTWKKDWVKVKELLPIIERQLESLGGRPHWGKLFTFSPADVQAHYERLPNFRSLAASYDPAGKFKNDFLLRNIFETAV